MIRSILVILTLVTVISEVKGQDSYELKLKQPYENSIGPGESEKFSIDLKKDELCYLVVQQKGIDLQVNVTGPDGEDIGNFDSPNGMWGAEAVVVTAESSGDHIFEVKPFSEGQPQGEFSIVLHRVQPVATTLEGRVDQLFIPWDNEETPGAAIAVSREGKVVYSKGYGEANLEYAIPNSPTTVFHIASVSKQFTAFAVTMLADQGKLSLNDDIRKHVPEVPDFGETITLKHLIHHTSGLRDQWNLLALAGWRLDDVITREQVLRLVSHQKELNFKPGEEFLYCNTGYTLLAETVSRVTGQSFAEWTRDNIFNPLGMDNTLFYDDHEKIVRNRAYSYRGSSGGYKKSVLSYANVGATSLFTTVEDLTKWAWNFKEMKVAIRRSWHKWTKKEFLIMVIPLTMPLDRELAIIKACQQEDTAERMRVIEPTLCVSRIKI
jgi:CubicO group peptidase (beta-lactamase class C family)